MLLIFPLLYLSPCNCTGFLSLPPAGLFSFSTVSPEQKASPLTFPLRHKQASPRRASALHARRDKLASLCSPRNRGRAQPLLLSDGTYSLRTPYSLRTRAEETPTSPPRGEDAPQDKRESRGGSSWGAQEVACRPASRCQGGLGEGARRGHGGPGCPVPNLLPAACRSGRGVPDCGLLVFLVSHWEGRQALRPALS